MPTDRSVKQWCVGLGCGVSALLQYIAGPVFASFGETKLLSPIIHISVYLNTRDASKGGLLY